MKTEIIFREGGFTLRNMNDECSVLFGDISAIHAYKADIFSYDLICVVFEKTKGEPVEVTEEASGFHDFMEQIVSRFSGSDAHWYEKVVHPPFAPCPTVIWKKEP